MLLVGIFIVYFFIILTFAVLYFFITYHLAKYSLNASLNRLMLPIFIIVSTLLLISNIMLFFSVNWSDLINIISL